MNTTTTLKPLNQSEINNVHGGYQMVTMPEGNTFHPQPSAMDNTDFAHFYKLLLNYYQAN